MVDASYLETAVCKFYPQALSCWYSRHIFFLSFHSSKYNFTSYKMQNRKFFLLPWCRINLLSFCLLNFSIFHCQIYIICLIVESWWTQNENTCVTSKSYNKEKVRKGNKVCVQSEDIEPSCLSVKWNWPEPHRSNMKYTYLCWSALGACGFCSVVLVPCFLQQTFESLHTVSMGH